MAAEPLIRAPINGSILKWARIIQNLSIDDLARSVQKSSDDIIQWESGNSQPTIRQIEKIANKLKRPLATFFMATPPDEFDPGGAFLRNINYSNTPISFELRLAIRAAKYTRDSILGIEDLSAELPKCVLPVVSIDDDPEDVAKSVRQVLNISIEEQMNWPNDENYYRWQSVLFDNGIIAQQYSGDLNESWGFALPDTDIPVVAVNSGIHAKTARTFTLFHEIGHVLLRSHFISVLDFGADELGYDIESRTERFCNRFSAAFLLPRDSEVVVREIERAPRSDFSARQIQVRASKFRVSKYVFLGRMEELGFLTAEKTREVRSEWWADDVAQENSRREKLRGRESNGGLLPHEKAFSQRGRRLTGFVLSNFRNGSISLSDTTELLGVSTEYLEKLESLYFERSGE